MTPIEISNGFLTVKNEKTGDHRTFRIRTQKEDAKFAPGSRIVSLLIGPDNTSDYQGFGFVKENGWIVLWKRNRTPHYEGLAKAVRLASRAIEQGEDTFTTPKATYTVSLSKRCIRCNRPLTTPKSLARGVGPECAAAMGIG